MLASGVRFFCWWRPLRKRQCSWWCAGAFKFPSWHVGVRFVPDCHEVPFATSREFRSALDSLVRGPAAGEQLVCNCVDVRDTSIITFSHRPTFCDAQRCEPSTVLTILCASSPVICGLQHPAQCTTTAVRDSMLHGACTPRATKGGGGCEVGRWLRRQTLAISGWTLGHGTMTAWDWLERSRRRRNWYSASLCRRRHAAHSCQTLSPMP